MTVTLATCQGERQMSDFGDIRSLLHGEPGITTWQELCRALDDYQGSAPLEEVVLPYCLQVLQRWPRRKERLAPKHWYMALLEQGRPEPRLLLCNTLDLRLERLDDAGIGVLANSPHLEHITWLDLRGGSIGPAGAQLLAASPLASGLTFLNLSLQHICDEGAQALARAPQLAQLTSLNLRDNQIGDEGARALASSPHLSNLEELFLWGGNIIRDRGARALAESPHLSREIRDGWRSKISSEA